MYCFWIIHIYINYIIDYLPIWSSGLASGMFSLIPPALESFALFDLEETWAFCWFCWEWDPGLPLFPPLERSLLDEALAVAVPAASPVLLLVELPPAVAFSSAFWGEAFVSVVVLLEVVFEGFFSSLAGAEISFSLEAWGSLEAFTSAFLWWPAWEPALELETLEEDSWDGFLEEFWAMFWEEEEWLERDSFDFWVLFAVVCELLALFWLAAILLLEWCFVVDELAAAAGLLFGSEGLAVLANFSLLSDNFGSLLSKIKNCYIE